MSPAPMSAQLEKNTQQQQQQLGSRSTMMDMQEVKARKPHSAAAADSSSALPQPAIGEEELDPSVQSAPLLSESERRKRHDKSVKSWVQAVLDRVWSAAFLGVAGFGLHEAQFVHELLYAREARRAWVHAGIFAASLVVFFGSYIELYRSMLLREKVSYETARTSTHAMLASMVASGICFSVGLWPVWHWLTLPYLFMCFWGVIVQIVVIFPVQAQRVIFAGGYLWFMHAYLSLFVV